MIGHTFKSNLCPIFTVNVTEIIVFQAVYIDLSAFVMLLFVLLDVAKITVLCDVCYV